MSDYTPALELKLLDCRRRLARLDAELEAVSNWNAAQPLRDLAGQVSRRLLELENEGGRKLSVVIVGPCGAGKSTLLNALAGQDGLAATGEERPTTRELAVFCSRPEDARYFKEKAGAGQVRVVTSPAARELRHLVIVDTPDTNSIEGEGHLAAVRAALGGADVLLCAFPAERATARDQIVFLKPWVERFNPEALYAVVTRSEKMPQAVLESEVMKPLAKLLEEVWGRPPAGMLAVSARARLNNPGWKPGEEPAPGYRDDFPLLRAEIMERLNRPELAGDMRAARAGEWVGRLEDQVRREASASAPEARRAVSALRRLSGDLWRAGLESLPGAVAAPQLEMQIARRLWGPLSWCLLAWAFALRAVDLLASMSGALRRFSGGGRLEGEDGREPAAGPEGALSNEVGRLAESAWPEIEDALRQAGFAARFRANPLRGEAGETFTRRLESRLRAERESAGRRLVERMFPGWGMALILNVLFMAPVGFLAFAGGLQLWFQKGLSGGFGREGAYFIGLCWILILALMHAWVGFAGRRLFGGPRLAGLLKDSGLIIQAAPEALDEAERLLALAGEITLEQK